MLKYFLYRTLMRLAHRFDWHHAPTFGPFEDGSTQKWCQWCGLRQTYAAKHYTETREDGYEMHNKNCAFGLGDIGGPGCICSKPLKIFYDECSPELSGVLLLGLTGRYADYEKGTWVTTKQLS